MQIVLVVAAAVIGALLAPLAVARPARVVLPLYVALVPIGSIFELSLPIPEPFNTASSLLGLVATAAIAGHVALYRRGRAPSTPVAMWALLIGWLTLTVFWAIDHETAFRMATVAWPLVALMVLVAILPVDEGDLDAVRLAAILSGIVIGAYALYLLVTGSGLSAGTDAERFQLATGGGETDPNILAASLLLPLGMSMERLILGGERWWRPRIWRIFGALGALFSVVAIVATGSRGGLGAAALTFALVLIFSRKRPEARPMIRRTIQSLIVGALALFLVGSISLSLDPTGPVHRLISQPPIGRIHEPEIGGSGRLEIWLTGYRLCARYCAVGSGVGTFPVAYNEIFVFAGATAYAKWNRPAHSIYIDMGIEAGVLGVTLLGLALLAEWRSMRQRRVLWVSPSLGAVFIGLLVANVFLSTLWFKYFWLVPIVARLCEGVALAPARVERLARPAAAPAPAPV